MSKPISPVIVTFKALPGVRLQAVGNYPGMDCPDCRLYNLEHVCEKANVLRAPMKMQPSFCGQRDYIWRALPPKEVE